MTLDKRQFRNYVKRTHDRAKTCSSSECVIANFLSEVKGFVSPYVDGDVFDDNMDYGRTAQTLPQWAQKVIERFDRLNGGEYGISIPAHRYRRSVLRALAA